MILFVLSLSIVPEAVALAETQQVGQRRGICAYQEVPALPFSRGYPGEGNVETVKVVCCADLGSREFEGHQVDTCRCADGQGLRYFDVAAQIERLGESVYRIQVIDFVFVIPCITERITEVQ